MLPAKPKDICGLALSASSSVVLSHNQENKVGSGLTNQLGLPNTKGLPGTFTFKIKTVPGKLWWSVTLLGFWKALSHMTRSSCFTDLSILNASSDIPCLGLILSNGSRNNALKVKTEPVDKVGPWDSLSLEWYYNQSFDSASNHWVIQVLYKSVFVTF